MLRPCSRPRTAPVRRLRSFLIELDPRAWLDWIGLPVEGPVHSIESDVGTVLAEVDKVLRVEASRPWLAHIELQANHDPDLPFRLLQYHALLLAGTRSASRPRWSCFGHPPTAPS